MSMLQPDVFSTWVNGILGNHYYGVKPNSPYMLFYDVDLMEVTHFCMYTYVPHSVTDKAMHLY